MQAMYLALARQDAGPLRSALLGGPQSPSDSQWAVFARNHDELTLDKLSGAERQEVFDAFGPEEDMQVYGRGLRRRLPPMLDGDPDRIRLVYSLMMSLPGTPTLFYGEEIGMGENLELTGRMAVRTPMQWQPGPMGGFSTVDDAAKLVPAVSGRPVRTGRGECRRATARSGRRCSPSCASGSAPTANAPNSAGAPWRILEHDAAAVLAHRCDWRGGSLLLCHNLADRAHRIRLAQPEDPPGTRYVDLADPADIHPVGKSGDLELDLEPWAARWFRRLTGDDPTLT